MKFSNINAAILPLLLLSPVSAQTCSSITSKKQCNSPCQWQKGTCVEGSPQAPVSNAPTPLPGPPTSNPPPSDCSIITRSKLCNQEPGCEWAGKQGCIPLTTSSPTFAPTSSPTAVVTPAPTAAATDIPSSAPSKVVTPAPTAVATDIPSSAPSKVVTPSPSHTDPILEIVPELDCTNCALCTGDCDK